MEVNVQLQVSGDNISSYDIYQNTDNFVTALATGVTTAELQSNYSLTADNSASVIRFVPDSACDNYKDIFINFNDTTPSITLVAEVNWSFNANENEPISLATNNSGAIFGQIRTHVIKSETNGVTWSSEQQSELGDSKIVCVNNEEFRFMSATGRYFKYYMHNGNPLDWRLDPLELTHNITGTILDFVMHNGIYYARTENSIYRSENGNTFISVLDYPTITENILHKSIAGYGNTIYATTLSKLYKSVDNGMNWVEVNTSSFTGGFSTLYVESESKFLCLNTNTSTMTGSWLYSQDGGLSFAISWVNPLTDATDSHLLSSDIIKIGDIYYFSSSNANLSYTSDSVFSENAGTLFSIPNTDISARENTFGRKYYSSIALIASENSLVFWRPELNESLALTQPTYVGQITNT